MNSWAFIPENKGAEGLEERVRVSVWGMADLWPWVALYVLAG